MDVETEPELTITTEDTDVASLHTDDLLHVAFPLPHCRVVSNERRRHVLIPKRRSRVTLVDSADIEKQFYLSPDRKVQRVTNPAIPVGPWYFELGGRDYSYILRSWQRDDALWHKILWPPARLFVQVWRGILDLQCRAYSLKLRAGFWGILFVIVVTAVGLATSTAPELSVAIGILGAFAAERVWEWWRARTRRSLAKGIVMRVRYKPYGPDTMRYGTLHLRPRGAVIVGGQPGQVWFSTEMCLRKGNQILATCAFANDIKGDLRYTTSAVAEAIHHRLNNGSTRTIYTPSSKHDPDNENLPDIVLHPSDRSFDLSFTDQEERNKAFSVRLKMHQVRILADVLEVMDQGRRL